MDDIHDDVDEDGVNTIEEKLCEITERCEHIDKRLEQILQKEVSSFCMENIHEVLQNTLKNNRFSKRNTDSLYFGELEVLTFERSLASGTICILKAVLVRDGLRRDKER